MKAEELFEDHVQPLIGKFRKWGYVQIMLSNVRAERDWLAHLMSS